MRKWTAKSLSIQMAFDAFRICLGGKPEIFSASEIIGWIKALGVVK